MTRLSDCRTAAEIHQEELRRHPVRLRFWMIVLRLEELIRGW